MTHDVVLPVPLFLVLISLALGLLGSVAVVALLRRFGIFRTANPSLVPMARGLFFNGMQDAVLIVDQRGRLLDFNPAAKDLLPELNDADLGRQATEVFACAPVLGDVLIAAMPCEITVGENNSIQHFDMRIVPIQSGQRDLGYAAVFTNNTAQAHLREQLRVHAETDTLTGIANRRRFLQTLQLECLRYNRYQGAFSLMLIDIDRFKYVNDRHGHPAGDAVLRSIVERLKPCLREQDLLARYGGEEFSVLMVHTGRDAALIAAERVRNAIASEPFLIEGITLNLTISIGLITQVGEWANENYLVKQADIALYKAKAQGRNRVVAADFADLPSPPSGSSGSRMAARDSSYRRPTASPPVPANLLLDETHAYAARAID